MTKQQKVIICLTFVYACTSNIPTKDDSYNVTNNHSNITFPITAHINLPFMTMENKLWRHLSLVNETAHISVLSVNCNNVQRKMHNNSRTSFTSAYYIHNYNIKTYIYR